MLFSCEPPQRFVLGLVNRVVWVSGRKGGSSPCHVPFQATGPFPGFLPLFWGATISTKEFGGVLKEHSTLSKHHHYFVYLRRSPKTGLTHLDLAKPRSPTFFSGGLGSHVELRFFFQVQEAMQEEIPMTASEKMANTLKASGVSTILFFWQAFFSSFLLCFPLLFFFFPRELTWRQKGRKP